VRASLACAPDEAPKVALAQERYRARRRVEENDPTWRIPICVAYDGGKEVPACGLLGGAPSEIVLPLPAGRCPRWIYPNADERGYFRFVLPAEGLRALARAQTQKARPAAERIGLYADTWALVQSGDVDAGVLLDLLEALRAERDPRVMEQIVAVLRQVGHVLVAEPSRAGFGAFVTRILLPIAREVGWDPRRGEPDDRRVLRVRVLAALSELTDDAWVTDQAERRAAAWLADARAVDADVAGPALAASARHAGAKRWDEIYAAAQRARSPEERSAAMGALGAFDDPALLRRALDLVPAEPLRIQDGLHAFRAAVARPEGQRVALAWMKERFAELRSKAPDVASGMLASVVETICDAPMLEDALLFGREIQATEGGERALVQALQKAEQCIDLRAREAPRVAGRLAAAKAR
jgi:aminopeptidase N